MKRNILAERNLEAFIGKKVFVYIEIDHKKFLETSVRADSGESVVEQLFDVADWLASYMSDDDFAKHRAAVKSGGCGKAFDYLDLITKQLANGKDYSVIYYTED